MTRIAQVEATVCTFHFFHKQEDVVASVNIPINLVQMAGGGFSFTYAPENTKAETNAHACKACAAKILPKLTEFLEWVEAKLVTPVEFEENYEDPKPEDDGLGAVLDAPTGEEAEDLEMDDDDRAAALEHLKERAGTVGAKVVPGNPATRVQNPTPGTEDKNAINVAPEFTQDAWKVYFKDGYIPDAKTAPKGKEREVCKEWYDSLSEYEQDLAGKFGPRLSHILINFWRKSRSYAEFSKLLKV